MVFLELLNYVADCVPAYGVGLNNSQCALQCFHNFWSMITLRGSVAGFSVFSTFFAVLRGQTLSTADTAE